MIIAYYEQGHSKRETANKFEIEPKQLRDWLQNKDKLMKVTPYIQKLIPGSCRNIRSLKLNFWIGLKSLEVN